MLVRDLMTPKVFSVRVDKKLLVAHEIMDWARVRHVPVVDAKNHLVGLISHRDLLRASIASVSTKVAAVERRQHLWTITIADVMTTDVQTIAPDAPVKEAARLMRVKRVGCLPVIAEERLAGIITEYDLLKLIEMM
jgi:CBS domain-containing membrane protein